VHLAPRPGGVQLRLPYAAHKPRSRAARAAGYNRPAMDVDGIEIRLLAVFDAVLRERSVTLAAETLGITQPAISQSLRRLRAHLGDPLFVRTPHGMEPTPRALELAEPIGAMLRIARERLGTPGRFDPARSERVFAFFSSDAGTVVFLPALAERLRAIAPLTRIRVVPVMPRRFPEGLQSGEADLALGSFPDLGAGIFQQRLYEDSYVCVVRGDHPRFGRRITRQQFLDAQHIVVTAEGTGHGHAAVERLLTEHLAPGRIAVRVASFLAAPVIVARSDYVLTIPARVARAFAEPMRLRVLGPPIDLPRFEVRQYWHERFHHDAANRWFRELVRAAFGE